MAGLRIVSVLFRLSHTHSRLVSLLVTRGAVLSYHSAQLFKALLLVSVFNHGKSVIFKASAKFRTLQNFKGFGGGAIEDSRCFAPILCIILVTVAHLSKKILK